MTSPAEVHNAITMLARVYGTMLAEQDAQLAQLGAEAKALAAENTRLRTECGDREAILRDYSALKQEHEEVKKNLAILRDLRDMTVPG